MKLSSYFKQFERLSVSRISSPIKILPVYAQKRTMVIEYSQNMLNTAEKNLKAVNFRSNGKKFGGNSKPVQLCTYKKVYPYSHMVHSLPLIPRIYWFWVLQSEYHKMVVVSILNKVSILSILQNQQINTIKTENGATREKLKAFLVKTEAYLAVFS